jgi:hypothetical protein
MLSSGTSLFAGSGCTLLEGSEPQAQLAYLQRDRKDQNGNCILFAIEHLGKERYAPASKTLVRYLDYPAPEEPRSKFFDHIPMVWNLYPASSALFLIGEGTVPDIVALIADGDASILIRLNAMEVVHGIYGERPPESVAVLARAARELSKADPVAGGRLWQAARETAGMCLDRHKTECYAALIQ